MCLPLLLPLLLLPGSAFVAPFVAVLEPVVLQTVAATNNTAGIDKQTSSIIMEVLDQLRSSNELSNIRKGIQNTNNYIEAQWKKLIRCFFKNIVHSVTSLVCGLACHVFPLYCDQLTQTESGLVKAPAVQTVQQIENKAREIVTAGLLSIVPDSQYY